MSVQEDTIGQPKPTCNPKLLGTQTYDDHLISGCTGGRQQCMAVCGGNLDIDIPKAFCRGTCVG